MDKYEKIDPPLGVVGASSLSSWKPYARPHPCKPRRRRARATAINDGLLTMQEAAERLGVCTRTLRGHIEDGDISYVELGHGTKRKRRKFSPADLDAFIANQRRKDASRMSIRRDTRSPYWSYNFQIGGHRFFGSTKRKTKREAEKVEAQARLKASRQIAQRRAAATSLRIDDVAGRYWQEVGQHHAGADNTERQIGYLIEFFGKDKLLTDITDADVAKLVAWRRGHRVIRYKKGKPKKDGPLISPFTVNDLTEQLKKLFTRAKLLGVHFDHQPEWKKHRLTEPEERVRELHEDEGDRLDAAMREDYAPFFRFAHASGLRLKECLLRWSEVDWGEKQISKPGKGKRRVTVPITDTIRELVAFA